jgi:hypothetical protein
MPAFIRSEENGRLYSTFTCRSRKKNKKKKVKNEESLISKGFIYFSDEPYTYPTSGQ